MNTLYEFEKNIDSRINSIQPFSLMVLNVWDSFCSLLSLFLLREIWKRGSQSFIYGVYLDILALECFKLCIKELIINIGLFVSYR